MTEFYWEQIIRYFYEKLRIFSSNWSTHIVFTCQKSINEILMKLLLGNYIVKTIYLHRLISIQGRRTGLGSRGLSPGTFWELLNGPFSQIAQKCNKKSHQKIVPPLSPGTFSEAEPPLRAQFRKTRKSHSLFLKQNIQ